MTTWFQSDNQHINDKIRSWWTKEIYQYTSLAFFRTCLWNTFDRKSSELQAFVNQLTNDPENTISPSLYSQLFKIGNSNYPGSFCHISMRAIPTVIIVLPRFHDINANFLWLQCQFSNFLKAVLPMITMPIFHDHTLYCQLPFTAIQIYHQCTANFQATQIQFCISILPIFND